MFEIELFICIKIELALNNLQRLICHKTQTNKQIKLFFLLFFNYFSRVSCMFLLIGVAWFFLLIEDSFFMLCHFFFLNFYRGQYFALSLVGMQLLLGSFHILHLENDSQMSTEEYHTYFLNGSYIHCLYHYWSVKISHIVKIYLFVFLFLWRLMEICADVILWLEEEHKFHLIALVYKYNLAMSKQLYYQVTIHKNNFHTIICYQEFQFNIDNC